MKKKVDSTPQLLYKYNIGTNRKAQYYDTITNSIPVYAYRPSSTGQTNTPQSNTTFQRLPRGDSVMITYEHSAETRAKISAGNKGKTRSAETRAKISAANKGKTFSAETRAKLSAANKGRTVSAETRAKLSAANKGKNFSAEHRAKLSAACRGRTASAETRAKLSAAKKNMSDETRAKISAAHTGTKKSAETRAKMSAGKEKQKKACKTPLGLFASQGAAAAAHNISVQGLLHRLKSSNAKWTDYYRVEETA